MSSMAGVAGPAIVEERGGAVLLLPKVRERECTVVEVRTNDPFAVVPLWGSPTLSAACTSLAQRSRNEQRWLISIAMERGGQQPDAR